MSEPLDYKGIEKLEKDFYECSNCDICGWSNIDGFCLADIRIIDIIAEHMLKRETKQKIIYE